MSGTQYVEVGAGGSWRAGGPKVGFAKTAGGLTVSGSMVRSAVAVTGDEAAGASMTGRVDQSLADDLTARTSQGGSVPTQFSRPTSARATAFAGGSSPVRAPAGSRERQRDRAAEATGGDRDCDHRLGALPQHECHGRPERPHAQRYRQPLYGAGSPSCRGRSACGAADGGAGERAEGRGAEHGWAACQRPRCRTQQTCDRRCAWELRGPDRQPVPGPGHNGHVLRDRHRHPTAYARPGRQSRHWQTALHGEGVTGTGRGAGRDITGTRYFCAQETPEAALSNPVAELDSRFSIPTPQRSAHLSPPREDVGEDRITGSFAAGGGKLTGNVEFQVRRRAAESSRPGASTQVSGEGSSQGTAITGNAWSNKGRVTGVDGNFASARNPTERGSTAKPFAGASTFKSKAKPEETSELVTGSFSKTGARVTLSGGAQT